MPRPVSEEEKQAQGMKVIDDPLSICQNIRDIYQIASVIDHLKAKIIMDKARTALVLSKRMSAKLIQYKQPTK